MSEGRYFPSSDSWGDRQNSEAGVSEQAPQSEVAHCTLPLILAQGSKRKSKQYISFQNKERGKKKIHSLSTFDSWLVVDAGEGGCSVLSTSFSFSTLSTLTSVVLLGGIILPLKHRYYQGKKKATDGSCFFSFSVLFLLCSSRANELRPLGLTIFARLEFSGFSFFFPLLLLLLPLLPPSPFLCDCAARE